MVRRERVCQWREFSQQLRCDHIRSGCESGGVCLADGCK